MIYIRHTSFRLYHCLFPKKYLHEIYHGGEPTTDSAGVTLNRTKAYNFSDIDERGEWFDVFVALIQYLLSGESKVGYLNNSHPNNPINEVWTRVAGAKGRDLGSPKQARRMRELPLLRILTPEKNWREKLQGKREDILVPLVLVFLDSIANGSPIWTDDAPREGEEETAERGVNFA
jgi:hypothetical protein